MCPPTKKKCELILYTNIMLSGYAYFTMSNEIVPKDAMPFNTMPCRPIPYSIIIQLVWLEQYMYCKSQSKSEDRLGLLIN